MEGEDEAAKEAPAPAADEEEEPLDFSKKKKKVRLRPSSLPARPRAPTAICLQPDECATPCDAAEEAQG